MRLAWEPGGADKAVRLIRSLARRLEHDAPGVCAGILAGSDGILTVIRPGLPTGLRRTLACAGIVENMNGTVRQVRRKVERWRDAGMTPRRTGAATPEAARGRRRPKARRQLPIPRAGLAARLRPGP